jgi:hypothetical protein
MAGKYPRAIVFDRLWSESRSPVSNRCSPDTERLRYRLGF